MPNVPILETNVQTRALPTVQQSGFNFQTPQVDFSAEQQAQSNLVSEVKALQQKAKQRGDEVALIGAQTSMDDWEATNIYDAESGALARKGQDAFNTPNVYMSRYDKDMSERRKALANEEQRLAFDKLVMQRRGAIHNTLLNHERGQMDAYASKQIAAGDEAALNRAMLNFNNPAIVQDAIDERKRLAHSSARIEGLDGDVLSNQLKDVESSTHLAVLRRWADTNTSSALGYYEKHKSTLTASDLEKADALIRPVELNHDAKMIADKVIEKAMDNAKKKEGYSALPSEFDVFTAIQEQAKDPDVAARAQKIADGYLSSMRNTRDQSWKDASQEAWAYVNNGREVPASVEARMKPEDVADMQNTGEPDLALYEDLRQRINSGDDVDLEEYRWRLRGKYDDLSQLQSDPKKRVNARTVDEVIKSAQGVILGYPNPKTKDDFKQIELFRRSIQKDIDAFQAGGKIATPEDVQKITDRAIIKHPVSGSWSPKKKYSFEFGAEELMYVDGIDATKRYTWKGKDINYNDMIQEFSRVLIERGYDPSDENILRMFRKTTNAGIIQGLNK